MTINGLDSTTFAVVAALMVVCAGGIGRLLWLLEGRPPLDRPSWWPGAAARKVSTEGGAPFAAGAPAVLSPAEPTAATPSAPPKRLAAVGACAVCCGAPLLVLAGVASFGVASTVSVSGGPLLLAALLIWARLTGRLGRWRRPRAVSAPSSAHGGTPTAAAPGSCCAKAVAAGRPDDGLAS